MAVQRRRTHPLLKEAEPKISEWRKHVVGGLGVADYLKAYLLIATTHVLCKTDGQTAVKTWGPIALDQTIRDRIFALQFGLECLKSLPTVFGTINEDIAADITTRPRLETAGKVILGLIDYVHARDAFLSYYYGAFDLSERSTSEHLIFVDDPRWPGVSDYAQTLLSFQTKLWRSIGGHDSVSEFPLNLDLLGLDSQSFLDLWHELSRACDDAFAPIITIRDLLSSLVRSTSFPIEQVSRFIELVTYSSEDGSKLSLFHCPLVRLTQHDLQVVTPALQGARLSTIVKRLAVVRGSGLSAFSSSIEEAILKRLDQHFSERARFRFRRRFQVRDEKGDIDVVAFEPSRGVLTLAEAKTFIPPDTVPEVYAANEEIREGFAQVEKTRRWFESASTVERRNVLDIPDLPEKVKPNFAFLASGFVGSDHLEYPENVLLADIHFLLRPEFRGSSFAGAIREFGTEIKQLQSALKPEISEEHFTLGNVKVSFPCVLKPSFST